MVDIVIGMTHKINKLDSKDINNRKKIFRGRIVGIRKARRKHNSKYQRKIDGDNAKAFIIIVDNDSDLSSLIKKRVEIRIL